MVKGLLAVSLLFGCLAVGGCSGDRHSDSVHRPKIDHVDKGQQRKPVEVYLKLSDNPQLYVAKKSEEGFLFTTARPGKADRKTCEQCAFRIVCKGPDCAEVCELCGKGSSSNTDHDSGSPCSGSREIEPVSRTTKRRERTTTVSSSTRQQDTVTTSTSKPKRFSDEDGSDMKKSDERIGPVRKLIYARREFRRKQLEERSKARFEARKLNGARRRTETGPKDEKSTTNDMKTTKQSEEKDEIKEIVKDSNENTKSLEHWNAKSDETHENDVVFHIPKKKEPIVHEEPTKSEKRVAKDEEEQSENSKILKLLEQIIKQKELDKKMEERKSLQDTDKSTGDKHKMEKVETTTKSQKHTELDGKDTKSSDANHAKVLKEKAHNEKEHSKHTFKHSDESDWDPMVKENLVQKEKKEEPDSWPQLIGKLIQTEIESVHLMIKHKPLKSALKNLKERFKPIFIATSKALANVFGVHAVDEETIKAKKDKDDEQKSSGTTLAPRPAITSTVTTTDDAHLSKPTAVKANKHRRRARIYSARRKARQRSGRPLSLRASVKSKLRELESLDKSGSAEQSGKGCSCRCTASRRRRRRHCKSNVNDRLHKLVIVK
uniref:Uncharacterized protein n=1 Tax=Anopheles maculatus TaxID=74869 RepID=A0A182T3F2_9DIPT